LNLIVECLAHFEEGAGARDLRAKKGPLNPPEVLLT
jgi:hypothetical protein